MTDNTVAPAASTPLQLTITPPQQQAEAPPTQGAFWNGEAPNFKDVLDTINPLQHIPIVSSIYQALTGDVPSTGSKFAGGALFGGPIGFVASLFDTIVQKETGSDTAGNLLAALEGKPVPALHHGEQDTQLALPAPPDHLSANQRAMYNAYVNAGMLV